MLHFLNPELHDALHAVVKLRYINPIGPVGDRLPFGIANAVHLWFKSKAGPPNLKLVNMAAAVDVDLGSRDVRREVRGEEQITSSHFIRLAQPPHRNAVQDGLLALRA
jgi:hypothetical protein